MKFSEYYKERNVQLGFVIIIITTFIAYLTTIHLISFFFLFAGFQFIIGTVIGEIYALRNRTLNQTILKCGLIVGVTGGVFSSFVISLWDTILGRWSLFSFLIWFVYILITGVVMGLLVGGIVSSYYMYREIKSDKYEEEKSIDDDFYRDLIEEK